MKSIQLLLVFLTISLTTYSQANWFEIETNTTSHLKCIDFVNNQIGFIGGEGILLKTTDGGATWNEVEQDSLFIMSTTIHDIQFFSETHGRIVLDEWSQAIKETFDGGLSWSNITPAHSGFCRFGSLFFFDEDNGFVGGGGCFEAGLVDRMEDGIWSVTDYPMAFNQDLVVNFDFLNEEIGMACTDYGRLWRTIDGGLTWDTLPTPYPSSPFTDVAFYTADTVYATYATIGGFGVIISIDGGLSWDDDWETATFFYPSMNAVHIDGAGNRFIGGLNGNDQSTGVIFSKYDTFWDYYALVLPINDIDSHSDSITFIVGDGGSVFTNVNPLLMSLNETNEFVQLRIFPNPSADFIYASLNLDPSQIDTIRLYDMTGQELPVDYTLYGQYGTQIEVNHLNSGSYLIEVLSDYGRVVQQFQVE